MSAIDYLEVAVGTQCELGASASTSSLRLGCTFPHAVRPGPAPCWLDL